MKGWKECKLGDLVTLNYGKALKEENRLEGSVPVFSSAGITGWHAKALVESEGIIIGRKGTIGKVYKTNIPFFCIDTAYYILPNDNVFNFNYLYYCLQTLGLEDLNSDSAVPGLNRDAAYCQDILLPPLPEQKAIAAVLSSLDDKIDLLHRQNKTLEAMAETLFRQWFVEEADEGWEEGVFSDLVSVKYGKDHKKLSDGLIPVYGSGGIMRYADTALYAAESVLIPRKGTLNNIIYIDEPFWTVDTMFYTEMKKPSIAKFIYHFVKDIDFVGMNVGSAVPSMTTEILNNLPINIPPDSLLQEFDNAVCDLYKKKKTNTNQIKTLENLRDTLLPKLMSGEVRVSQ